jgi:hypothetical protein
MNKELPSAPSVEERQRNADAFHKRRGLARSRNPARWMVITDSAIFNAIASGFLIYLPRTDMIQLTAEGAADHNRIKQLKAQALGHPATDRTRHQVDTARRPKEE